MQRLIDGIKWLAPIHRWTSVVTIAFFSLTVAYVIAIGLGITTVRQAPGEALVAIYEAAQDRRLDDFQELLDYNGKAEFAKLTPAEAEAVLSELTNDFTTINVSFLGIKNYGHNAVAGVLRELDVGYATTSVEVLVKEGRFWHVEWPLGVARWNPSNKRFDPYFIERTN